MENTPKDMLTHIREQEEILNISYQQSKRSKQERLDREQLPACLLYTSDAADE